MPLFGRTTFREALEAAPDSEHDSRFRRILRVPLALLFMLDENASELKMALTPRVMGIDTPDVDGGAIFRGFVEDSRKIYEGKRVDGVDTSRLSPEALEFYRAVGANADRILGSSQSASS